MQHIWSCGALWDEGLSAPQHSVQHASALLQWMDAWDTNGIVVTSMPHVARKGGGGGPGGSRRWGVLQSHVTVHICFGTVEQQELDRQGPGTR